MIYVHSSPSSLTKSVWKEAWTKSYFSDGDTKKMYGIENKEPSKNMLHFCK